MKRAIRNTQARNTRSKAAKDVIIREIPAILKANARARRGVEAAELIVDPPPSPAQPNASAGHQQENASSASANAAATSPPRITLRITDTLEAAYRLLTTADPPTSHRHRPPRVGVLNMASPLRPGGGVLSGAASQEEWLCARTTLYPSLKEEFYRLPEVGAIYTPDVLVFRSWDDAATEMAKADRFLVDVVSAGMLRFPDLDGDDGEEKVYAEQKDRELVVRKMRAVMRIMRGKGVEKVVLGAWGCGAYGNPVGEIAAAWSKVLLGRKAKGNRPTGGRIAAGSESWEGLEVVFAIKDAKLARKFATAFGPEIELDEVKVSSGHSEDSTEELEDEDGDEPSLET
ncbi:hypothetical protein CONLIGDRAFT_91701 [Coniochaeta ligniaria NRRL 30616]|uniref:Microbial-type PARG catalytic domain-containing protein n=1 Tax=Coniochaeta ligniaria NRRL 30616 TaxID=1408157 RepID=A0A1J7IW84_9PEZI|nr:hypothetical protein CONLIGDRAFT_91701 [Coniochaeta ligniaria NRRL 30616]